MARWLQSQDDPVVPGAALYQFVAERGNESITLKMSLVLDGGRDELPQLSLEPGLPGAKLAIERKQDGRPKGGLTSRPSAGQPTSDANSPMNMEYQAVMTITLPASIEPIDDDEIVFVMREQSDVGVPICRVVLRRTTCRISTALIERGAFDVPVRAESRAALLWYSWRRFREVVGLKRFTSGKSGSDVFVFRPRLRDPVDRAEVGSHVPGVIEQAWGSCLLVKTGEVQKVREEWERFQAYLVDRQHPFMSRSEACLIVHPAGREPAEESQATMIGSFLGGELVNAEALEQLIRGTSAAVRCTGVLGELFSVLGTWYAGSAVRPLRDWRRMFQFNDDGCLKLFGEFDFTQEADRKRFRRPLAWDIAFIKEDHLRKHWLGANDGLLWRLMDWNVRYSLIHGDLHARNVLADPDNIWLLDFGHTEVAPTLFDFAKLEVWLRMWCLQISGAEGSFERAAVTFETQLLDHMTGIEATLQPVRDLAEDLGARPEHLVKIAECILCIRGQATAYELGFPDRRDYLAVLFITVLSALQYAGRESQLTGNFRLLVNLAWLLEDVLSRIVAVAPYRRERVPLKANRLIYRDWLAAPAAAERVSYLMRSPVDCRVLEPLAATRGVIQNSKHHLDVYDHTLAVLTYVEHLLEDPLEGFLNPAELDRHVAEDLLRQGFHFPAPAHAVPAGSRPETKAVDHLLSPLREFLAKVLNTEGRLALKWGALFHDVGKPAARSLSVDERSGEEDVQFLGHEVYGRQLVGDLLTDVLSAHSRTSGQGPEETELAARVGSIILRHHSHHQLVERYATDAKRLRALENALQTERLGPDEWKALGKHLDAELSPFASDFPLLILHGFADTLACRGPASTRSIVEVAEIDLRLLAICLRFSDLKNRLQREQTCKLLLKGANEDLKISGPRLGRVLEQTQRWCVEELRRRGGENSLSRSEVIAKAREFLPEADERAENT